MCGWFSCVRSSVVACWSMGSVQASWCKMLLVCAVGGADLRDTTHAPELFGTESFEIQKMRFRIVTVENRPSDLKIPTVTIENEHSIELFEQI